MKKCGYFSFYINNFSWYQSLKMTQKSDTTTTRTQLRGEKISYKSQLISKHKLLMILTQIIT